MVSLKMSFNDGNASKTAWMSIRRQICPFLAMYDRINDHSESMKHFVFVFIVLIHAYSGNDECHILDVETLMVGRLFLGTNPSPLL